MPVFYILTFDMCSTQSNAAIMAATAATLCVYTPTLAPCVPATTAPWTPRAAIVTIGNMPALNNSNTCNCIWGGVISITRANTTTTLIP
jgi:hypothetical protein